MGKSMPSTSNLHKLANVILSSHKPFRHRKKLPNNHNNIVSLRRSESKSDSDRSRLKKMEETSVSLDGQNRMPLALVVSECVRRWFQDTLKEAKAGDVAMQVLVAQMYRSGYGIPQDAHKGRAWINRASKTRPSALGLINKRPGWNATDSDSDEVKDDGK